VINVPGERCMTPKLDFSRKRFNLSGNGNPHDRGIRWQPLYRKFSPLVQLLKFQRFSCDPVRGIKEGKSGVEGEVNILVSLQTS
jgi:hypothetical protein